MHRDHTATMRDIMMRMHAAGPVRPAANAATAMVHTTLHAPDQNQCALSEESESFDSLTTGVAVISFITE